MTADHVYRWKNPPYNNGLYGRRCRVLAYGKKNSVRVEFTDGTRHVVSRNAIRKEKPQ